MEWKTLRHQDQYSCDILIHLNLFDNMTRQSSRSLVAPRGPADIYIFKYLYPRHMASAIFDIFFLCGPTPSANDLSPINEEPLRSCALFEEK